MYKVINNISLLIMIILVALDCLTIESWPIMRVAVIGATLMIAYIIENAVLVFITRIMYFDKKIPRDEVVDFIF